MKNCADAWPKAGRLFLAHWNNQMRLSTPVVLSSEHSSNRVPKVWRKQFTGAQDILETHRGWDPGVGQLEKAFAAIFGITVLRGNATRLLIELNRSLHHPKLFSEFTRELSATEKSELVQTIYQPYREQVHRSIQSVIDQYGFALHVSLHTFTPVLEGKERAVDVGFLYDPKRTTEKRIVDDWIEAMRHRDRSLRLRRNQPYLGTADGLTKAMRLAFTEYSGIELELNQSLALDPKEGARVSKILAETARQVASRL